MNSWVCCSSVVASARGVPAGLVAVALGVGGPQGEVVPQELHDEGRVLVAVLVERVQLRDGVVEGLKRDEGKP